MYSLHANDLALLRSAGHHIVFLRCFLKTILFKPYTISFISRLFDYVSPLASQLLLSASIQCGNISFLDTIKLALDTFRR